MTRANIDFLIADDCESTREIHGAYLSAKGRTCDFASDGREAIEKALTRRYSCLVTDNQMPGRTGVEVAEMTRHLFKPGELPLFLVTSDPIATIEARTAGLHDVVVMQKPLGAIQIARILARTDSLKSAATQEAVQAASVAQIRGFVPSGVLVRGGRLSD